MADLTGKVQFVEMQSHPGFVQTKEKLEARFSACLKCPKCGHIIDLSRVVVKTKEELEKEKDKPDMSDWDEPRVGTQILERAEKEDEVVKE